MDFEKYKELVYGFFENDNREENYQNRVLIPFFEDLCENLDVVDTSRLTKQWKKIHREAFADRYTPDLLIASKWKLIKEKDDVQYKALVEIKTPTANDRKHAELEIKEYITKVPFVILTDCITWQFYMKEKDDNNIYWDSYSLEKGDLVPVWQRHKLSGKKTIRWDITDWDKITRIIRNCKIEKKKIYENKN